MSGSDVVSRARTALFELPKCVLRHFVNVEQIPHLKPSRVKSHLLARVELTRITGLKGVEEIHNRVKAVLPHQHPISEHVTGRPRKHIDWVIIAWVELPR